MRRFLFTSLAAASIGVPALAETKTIYAVMWEGCEHACRSMVDTIETSGFDAEVVLRVADQDKSRLPEFVQEAREIGADLVMTYGTSVTLGVAGRKADDGDPRYVVDTPVVFYYVADPFGTGIADGFEGTGRPHVAGTFNRVPEEVNIRTIRSIDPDFEHLGILYNSNERNSVIKVEEMTTLAHVMGFDLTALEIDPGNADAPDPALIPERVTALAEAGVDFIYLGSSSFLRLHADVFTEAAVENGLPVLSPYEELVRENLALVSIAARARDVGRIAAEQALRILRDDAVPGNLPIARVTEYAYVVNLPVAQSLNVYPPLSILQVAEVVN